MNDQHQVYTMENSSKKPQQKRKVLSILTRAEIIEELNNGVTASELSHRYNISVTAVSKMKKKEKQISDTIEVLKNCDGKLDKKRYNGIEKSLVEKKLYEWFLPKRSMGWPISGPILKQKALLFHQLLNCPGEFVASNGWLDKFKKRHGIRNLSIQGEKLSADSEASEIFKEKLANILKVTEVNHDFIYNCDETGLYWKLLPSKTLVGRKERCADGRKKPKDRLTIMVCSNASGSHKVPLYVIGKAKEPRCFKGIKTLPVGYGHQSSAWMETDLMLEWYNTIFIPSVIDKHKIDKNSNIKIFLIMDNAPCHPSQELLNSKYDFCTIIYLPPNVTSLIQPMDQGIIENFKRNYRKRVLMNILADDDNGESFLNSFNLLKACNSCALSWHDVSAETIQKCWKKIFMTSSSSNSTCETSKLDSVDIRVLLENIPAFKDILTEAVENWLHVDDDEVGWQTRTDEEIAFGLPSSSVDDEDSNETINSADEDATNDSEDSSSENNLSLSEVRSSLEHVIKWYQSSEINSPENLNALLKCQQDIIKQIVTLKIT